MCVCALMCYDLLPCLYMQVHLHDCVCGCSCFHTAMLFLSSTVYLLRQLGVVVKKYGTALSLGSFQAVKTVGCYLPAFNKGKGWHYLQVSPNSEEHTNGHHSHSLGH